MMTFLIITGLATGIYLGVRKKISVEQRSSTRRGL